MLFVLLVGVGFIILFESGQGADFMMHTTTMQKLLPSMKAMWLVVVGKRASERQDLKKTIHKIIVQNNCLLL